VTALTDNQQLTIGQLYYLANQCSHDYPTPLAQKIEYLSEIQILLGRRAADALYDYKRKYVERKRVYAETYLASPKDKAQRAELAIVDIRLEEARLESDMVRWKNAVDSNKEVINSLKYSLKTLLAEIPNPASERR
jgi:beta-xylosidase